MSPRTGRRRCTVPTVIAAAGLALAGCDDMLVEDRTLRIEATGAVGGFVFLDVDGSGTPGEIDEPVEGLRVRLLPAGGGEAVASAVTDESGIFRLGSVPVGAFRLVPDPATVPDSVEVFDLDPAAFILAAGDTLVKQFRLSFPTHTVEEVRELPPGRRVFTHGIALNPRVAFGDGVVHLQEGETYLRATRVERATFSVGDSVRVLGRTRTDAGQPVLDDVRSFLLVSQAALPRPVEMGSGAAAAADEGRRDAALVRIRNAEILDTVSVGGNLLVTADDGTGSVEVVLRDFIPFDRSAMRPDSTLFDEAVGLLVPALAEGGEIRWRLTPRFPTDLLVAEKELPDG